MNLYEMFRKDQLGQLKKHHTKGHEEHYPHTETPGLKRKSRKKVKYHQNQLDRIANLKRRISKYLDNKEVKKDADKYLKGLQQKKEYESIERDHRRFKRKAASKSKRARKLRT